MAGPTPVPLEGVSVLFSLSGNGYRVQGSCISLVNFSASSITICSLFVNFDIFVVSDQCLHDQRDLLMGLKNSLKFNSALSTKLVHWNQSLNCCSWKGVTCSEEGRVIGLNLNNESIYGGLHKSSSLFGL